MNVPFIALLLQGIPEQIALVTLAFVIAKLPFTWKKAVLIGTSFAVFAYVIRLFPIPFGLHITFQSNARLLPSKTLNNLVQV